jgi:hypothetical protein
MMKGINLMEIKFSTRGGYSQTLCPHNQHTEGKWGGLISVGSIACGQCKYYKSRRNRIVKCNWRERNEM